MYLKGQTPGTQLHGRYQNMTVPPQDSQHFPAALNICRICHNIQCLAKYDRCILIRLFHYIRLSLISSSHSNNIHDNTLNTLQYQSSTIR